MQAEAPLTCLQQLLQRAFLAPHHAHVHILFPRHVLGVHQQNGSATAGEGAEDAERFLSRYIAYARGNCFPRLTEEARRELQGKYVEIRDKVSPCAMGERCKWLQVASVSSTV